LSLSRIVQNCSDELKGPNDLVESVAEAWPFSDPAKTRVTEGSLAVVVAGNETSLAVVVAGNETSLPDGPKCRETSATE